MTVIEAVKRHIDKKLEISINEEKNGPKKGAGKFTVTYRARVEKETLISVKDKIEELEVILNDVKL